MKLGVGIDKPGDFGRIDVFTGNDGSTEFMKLPFPFSMLVACTTERKNNPTQKNATRVRKFELPIRK